MKNYDICVIGAGSAGLVAATTALRSGAKTALIEKAKIGGECLHSGCIPSKTLIHAARLKHAIAGASKYGFPAMEIPSSFRFGNVMRHVRDTVEKIYKNENKNTFGAMGIDVHVGDGSFVSPDTFTINNEELTSRFFIICTGSSPRMPPVPGLHEANPFTNVNIWDIDELPRELLVVGGGPIGVELAQCFARFGSLVTILVRSSKILKKEEPEIADSMESILRRESVRFLKETHITEVSMSENRPIVQLRQNGETTTIAPDAILVATGRIPNIASLGLQRASVEYDAKGITVDEYLRTSARHIFACGDCIGRHLFTHAASYHADVALNNILRQATMSVKDAIIPWVTFTDPEIAHVGLTEEQARGDGADVRTIRVDCTLDRFVTEGQTEGFLKIILDNNERIIGAHCLGAHSGEYIQHLTLAMRNNLSIEQIARTIYPYPTFSEIVRKAFVRFLRTKK